MPRQEGPIKGLSRGAGLMSGQRSSVRPLVWLGMADPCDTRQHVIEDDPDREAAATLLSAWHSAVGGETTQIAHVLQRAASSPELASALLAVAASKNDGNRIDPRRLSWWCREWRDRVVNGLSLVRGKDYGKSATWRVEQGCGITGISGIKSPSKNSQTSQSDCYGDKADRHDANFRKENNPTSPVNPNKGSKAVGRTCEELKFSAAAR